MTNIVIVVIVVIIVVVIVIKTSNISDIKKVFSAKPTLTGPSRHYKPRKVKKYIMLK